MKVRITFEVPDGARTVIGIMASGENHLASHDEITDYIRSQVGERLDHLNGYFERVLEDVVAEVTKQAADFDKPGVGNV